MGITLSPEEKAQLKREDFLIAPLAGCDGVETAVYHDPATGQEFRGLPVDPYHLSKYLRKGWLMGSASAGLQAKWAAGEAERTAADDALVAKHVASPEHREALATDFNEAVSAAVQQVLEKLGVETPSEKQEAPVPEQEKAEEVEPVQLDFFQTVDAPSTAPSLRLVENDAT